MTLRLRFLCKYFLALGLPAMARRFQWNRVCLSACFPQKFLRIGSLIFFQTWHSVKGPIYGCAWQPYFLEKMLMGKMPKKDREWCKMKVLMVLLTFCKNWMLVKNLVLKLWPKMHWVSDIRLTIEVRYINVMLLHFPKKSLFLVNGANILWFKALY